MLFSVEVKFHAPWFRAKESVGDWLTKSLNPRVENSRSCASVRSMKHKTRKPLTDAELKAKAISRWENEGGAIDPAPGPAADGKKDGATRPATARPALTDPPKRSRRPP
jgi:hypothetical protein